MIYKEIYRTPDNFDDMIMSSDGNALTSLLFFAPKTSIIQSKPEADCMESGECKEKEMPSTVKEIFESTRKWLDIYFSGKQPDFTPAYKLENTTPFRKEVSDIMLSIPFGKIMTYGEIAALIAEKHGIKKMSAQAVGAAVGWNPICIIIPCHRVLGANNKLTGYGGGLKNKIELLKLEQFDYSHKKPPILL